MFPELVSLGPLSIHTYGLMVALGILAGVGLAERLHRRSGGEPGRVVDMALIVVICGLLGARIFFILINLEYYLSNPLETVMLWKGGLVFYGGLAGGILGLFASVRHHNLPFWPIMDLGAIAIALGHGLGRLGCFTSGCCYGKITDVPWAVTFTDPRCLALEVLDQPVHPTQLYSFLFLAYLTGFLVWMHPRLKFHGQVTASYLTLYGLFRFSIEFLRGDPRGSLDIAGITLATSQWISVVAVFAGISLYFYLLRRQKQSKAST